MQTGQKRLDVKASRPKREKTDSAKTKEEEKFIIEELHDQPDVNLFDSD